MKIKKIFRHSKNRTAWRVLLNNESLLLIEERDLANREVFFQCYQLASGKKMFSDLQPVNKFWAGVELFDGDIVYFHGYRKPDMPWHQGIYAYSVSKGKFIWSHPDYVFSFGEQNNLVCQKQEFESLKFYSVDKLTGELLGEIEAAESVNQRRYIAQAHADYSRYEFPNAYTANVLPESDMLLSTLLKQGQTIVETLSYNGTFFYIFQETESTGLHNQWLRGVDISTGNIIFNETINENQNTFLFDSFFVFSGYLITIKNKSDIIVYKLKEFVNAP